MPQKVSVHFLALQVTNLQRVLIVGGACTARSFSVNQSSAEHGPGPVHGHVWSDES